MARAVTFATWCIVLSPVLAFGQTLPEAARQNGGTASTVVDIDAPISRPGDLMTQADLVVRGRVNDVAVRLNPDQSAVITEYTIAPLQVLKQRKADAVAVPGTATAIIVQRSGGSLTTADGLHLMTSVNIFPEAEAFRAGEEVLLFLRYNPDTKKYAFASGEFGAYRIRDGMATLMTAEAAKRRGDRPIASSALIAELLRVR